MKPSIGRIVHYMSEDGETVRPATIVAVWNEESGLCNLAMLTDGSNDAKLPELQGHHDRYPATVWITSVERADEPTPRHWHWPPRV